MHIGSTCIYIYIYIHTHIFYMYVCIHIYIHNTINPLIYLNSSITASWAQTPLEILEGAPPAQMF